ncbi:hypothetical protein [Clostridium gasigenes]|uniref:Uncharacterized protein n=1 Tax=Clostridium gasigenes TaxID=94869 RepID=A0A7X0VQX7_9CLOT|nr:hypothetical protein [Clostridium gasigenes]MBB6714779.1 hypothetical protein [Clostridium gasigenes]
MRIREGVVRNNNDLPGYKLVGYSQVATPMYQRKVHVLVLRQKSIPVVEEFVLNFYKEGLNLDDIMGVLGLEQQLIDEAVAGLIQRDYINHINRDITESGENYLDNNKVESLEKIEIIIVINAITGDIEKLKSHLMVTRSIKNKGIRALRANIDKPNVTSIDFKAVKKVFNQYKGSGKEGEDENYSGDMLDIAHMEGNTTKYKRIDILIFENTEKDVRVIAFDGFKRLEEYEENLLELDAKGINLLKYNFEDYFREDKVKAIDKIVRKSDENLIEYEKVNELYERYLDSIKGNILIIVPLVSECTVTEAFIDTIEKKLKNDINIKFILCGKDCVDEYQKKAYKRLKQLSDNIKNLQIQHTPFYLNKMIVNLDKKESIISVYEENSISLSSTSTGVVEKFYEAKEDSFDKINNIISEACKVSDLIKVNLFNKESLKEILIEILNLVRDADGYMYSSDDIGWIGVGEVPEANMFIDAPLANDGEKFRTFIDTINKSLIESLEINSKSKGVKDYFWNQFKDRYPELQNILDKIKTYRNKSNHLELTKNNKQKYYDFLNRDLNGCLPDFIENGYQIIQHKILDELKIAIKKSINELK